MRCRPDQAAAMSAFLMNKAFLGASVGVQNGSKTTMMAKATKIVKKAAQQVASKVGGGSAKGFRRYQGDALWLPNTTRPDWLDGSLPGDRGFDPLGLSKPTSYLQVDLDSLDNNKAVNRAGQIIGTFTPGKTQVSSEALAPYNEVFSLERFRENELIHGRWAMLATLGVIVAEATTGVSWVDAGKVELDSASYLGFNLPFSISQLVWIEALLVGGAEIYRNGATDLEERIYPGGYFDPLSLASDASARTAKLREAEIKHGRLAMVAFLGFGVQAFYTGEGALGSLAKFANNFSPELAEKISEF
ncbi:hypothetical protein WJX81_006465 [Elliptochloris bilobata]|uniref:Chlorophyll a-b binding protein, chloroplastic n=1 Tax=Elliptochloris bilobata TaxID=381761 RepID=A0AAW1QN74_9CHLO